PIDSDSKTATAQALGPGASKVVYVFNSIDQGEIDKLLQAKYTVVSAPESWAPAAPGPGRSDGGADPARFPETLPPVRCGRGIIGQRRRAGRRPASTEPEYRRTPHQPPRGRASGAPVSRRSTTPSAAPRTGCFRSCPTTASSYGTT